MDDGSDWDEAKFAWVALGERLFSANREKFREVSEGLADVCEAQEIILRFDSQLFMRGRPRKVYRG